MGTAHLENNYRDYLNVQFDDIRSPRRQQEIVHCVDQLTRFRPTKVAVEILSEQGRDLNDDHRRYRAGTFALTANEIHQLGFRTAVAAGHEQIHAIIWTGPIDWDRAVTFAQERQPALFDDMFAPWERSTTELTRLVGADCAVDSRDPPTSMIDGRNGSGDQPAKGEPLE